MLMRYIFQVCGSIGIMFFVNWKLTLVLLSVVPLVGIGAVAYGKQVKKTRKKFQVSPTHVACAYAGHRDGGSGDQLA